MSALARDRLLMAFIGLGAVTFTVNVWADMGVAWGLIALAWTTSSAAAVWAGLDLARTLTPLAERLDAWRAEYGEGVR